jgi:15-cis-phytoene desaturase
MAGDWTSQKFLGSMEGAGKSNIICCGGILFQNFVVVLAGKLAAEVVAERAAGVAHRVREKDIQQDIWANALGSEQKDPVGVVGDGAFPFGGGGILTAFDQELLMKSDPSIFQT